MKEIYETPELECLRLVPAEQLTTWDTDFDQLCPDGITPGTPGVPNTSGGELIVP